MKTKYLLLGIAALAAVGGMWFGRIAWRAHHQFVTLRVRHAPLAEVLREIEKQTGTRIRSEKDLDARITLQVVNKPLAYVMDWVAEQAGARWSTLYAVYGSSGALGALDSALRGDGKLEPAGWTRIAPNLADLTRAPFAGHTDLPPPGPDLDVRPLPPGAVVSATEDVNLDGPAGAKPVVRGQLPMAGAGGPMVLKVVRRGGGGDPAAVEEEVWTPEELVAESALTNRLAGRQGELATPAAAAEAARKVQGHWTTYIALRKSRLGMGFGGFSAPRPQMNNVRYNVADAGTNQAGTNINILGSDVAPPLPDADELAKRERNEHFARLTPEQRVQRARERLQVDQK